MFKKQIVEDKNVPLIRLRRRLKNEEDVHLISDSYPNLPYQTKMYNVSMMLDYDYKRVFI